MPNTAPERLHIVIGVVIRPDDGHVLIARRPEGTHLGGLWEFPGGKVEVGESPQAALARELREEIGIELMRATPLASVEHDYADRAIFLDAWRVDGFKGTVEGREGQLVEWVPLAHIGHYRFPEANKALLFAILEQVS